MTKTGNVPSAKTGSKLSEGPKERGAGKGGGQMLKHKGFGSGVWSPILFVF